MPHQCTDCGRTFEDGSKEMLSGCPGCGGNKFQYHPGGVEGSESTSEEPPEPAVDSSVARTVGNAATAVRDLVGSDSSPPEQSESLPDSTGPDTESPPAPATSSSDSAEPSSASVESPENDAQASARSEVVSTDDLPLGSGTQPGPASRSPAEPESGTRGEATPAAREESTPGTTGTPESESTGSENPGVGDGPTDQPDLSDLREELNEQFESIRVLEPGQYELNLMELFDREEYIVALQEDGKYTIQVPDRWED